MENPSGQPDPSKLLQLGLSGSELVPPSKADRNAWSPPDLEAMNKEIEKGLESPGMVPVPGSVVPGKGTYKIIVDEDIIGEQVNIINGFVSLMIEKSEELEPEFVKTVDKHFWDLA